MDQEMAALIEILKWPVAVLFFGLGGLAIFRAPISKLIQRIRRGKLGGQEFETDEPRAPQARSPSPSEAFAELRGNLDNALFNQAVQATLDDERMKQITEPQEREKLLLHYFVSFQIATIFERAYIKILGSQLTALWKLNTAASIAARGEQIADLQTTYDLSATLFPSVYSNYSFDQWLEFLVSWALVERQEDLVVITLRGREFLKYIVQQGYNQHKLN